MHKDFVRIILANHSCNDDDADDDDDDDDDDDIYSVCNTTIVSLVPYLYIRTYI